MTTIATATIVAAIESRTCIRIDYDPGDRLIEPHAYGRGEDGQLLLRAYQVAGASASGEHEHWKLFRVDRVRDIEPTDQPAFVPRPGYKHGDSAMKGGIIAEL
ncbi:MAG: WYL domain-containing protein [Alphaproteobacteria bacterium]|nr:WYL domain-containing protein [Alphaproteobacteria bacterium]